MAMRLERLVADRDIVSSPRIDPITQLPNRQQFLSDQEDAPPAPRTLVLLTLADARAFNEILRALGHARAEGFIRAGAARAAEIAPRGTVVYHVSLLSFAFLVSGNSKSEPPAVIERLSTGFAQPILCDSIPIDTRVGIGLRPVVPGASTASEDLRAALAAAQDSRLAARGWAWYDQRSDAAHLRAFQLLTDLKAALAAEEQLHLVFQPKVALTTGACVSAEALLRWTHPTLGPISPGEFIPLAEATALVTPLTRWVIEAATAQVAAWSREGLDMHLAVNVSPKNLEEPDFVEYLLFCCAAHGIDRTRIELEVTEGVSAGQGRLILDRLAALRGLGFSIAIDDFGSGYSNMSYLTRLSAQTLKIDQSLVRGVEADTQGGKLVASIVQMGHDLGYKIVAEGIETETERALLAGWGCDLGQGWHFGRPMTADSFRDWHAARGK